MNTKGVNFQPSKRGQFSAAVDTADIIDVKRAAAAIRYSSWGLRVPAPRWGLRFPSMVSTTCWVGPGDSPAEQEKFLRRIVIGASRQDAHEVWDTGSPLYWVSADAPPFVRHPRRHRISTNPEQARASVELPGAQRAFEWLLAIRIEATVEAIDRFCASCILSGHPRKVGERFSPSPKRDIRSTDVGATDQSITSRTLIVSNPRRTILRELSM